MEGANLSDEELKELIFYGLKENNVDASNIDISIIKSILIDYKLLCMESMQDVMGELDTFQRAACLLVAINRSNLLSDKKLKASIAVDVSNKMCEKPYCYTGKAANVPKKLEEVDIKEVFKNDMYSYNYTRNLRIQSLANEELSPKNYYLNLELFYIAAIHLKHFNCIPTNNYDLEKHEDESSKNAFSTKQKIKSIFTRFFNI